MKYFSFLGTSKYDEAIYRVVNQNDNSGFICRFAQEFIVERHLEKEPIDSVYVLCTDTPECLENYDSLKYVLQKYPDIQVQKINVELEMTSEMFINVLDEYLDVGDQVIIDVTYGFRSSPMTLIQILPFFQISKKITIHHIYYSRLERRQPEISVCHVEDYVEYHKQSRIVNYLNQFIDTYKVPDIEVLKTEKMDEKLFYLFRDMSDFQLNLNRSEVLGALASLKRLNQKCNKLLNNNQFQSLHYYLRIITSELDFIARLQTHQQMINALACKLSAKGYYQAAITLLERSSVITFEEMFIGNIESPSVKLRTLETEARSLVELIFKSIASKADKDKCKEEITKWNNEKSNQKVILTDKNISLIVDSFFADMKVEEMSIFFQLRNTVSHGNSFSLSSGYAETEKRIKICIERYAEVLDNIKKNIHINKQKKSPYNLYDDATKRDYKVEVDSINHTYKVTEIGK